MAVTLVSLLLLPVLGLFVGPSFGLLDSKLTDPLLVRHGGLERSTELVADLFNTTDSELGKRSLAKRDFISACNRAWMDDAFREAEEILQATESSIRLILDLYTANGIVFKPSKRNANDRTSDENLAMDTFVAFFHQFYHGEGPNGDGDPQNRDGKDLLNKMLKRTRDILINVQAHNRGLRTTPRGTYGNVYFHCDENFLSTVDENGRTFRQLYPNVPEPTASGGYHLWSQNFGQEYWHAMSKRCAADRVTLVRDNIRVNPDLYAYVARGFRQNPLAASPWEIMVFCPVHFAPGELWEQGRNSPYQLRDLRKSRGQTAPTALQQQFVGQALNRQHSIGHFNQFISTIIVHESTHARMFVGDSDDLATTDVHCIPGQTTGWTRGETSTRNPNCLAHLARQNDDSSERDAHTFATYAVATYANAIDWTTYIGIARGSW